MDQATAIYLTNIIIGAILAGLMTHYWLRQGRSAIMQFWMLSGWLMMLADVFFAMRPELSNWVGRVVPTCLVTIGHACLLFGAERTAHHARRLPLIIGIVAVHLVALVVFFRYPQWGSWRMVVNGVIWGGLSLAAGWTLRRAHPVFWKSPVAPASAFYAHAIFHGLRVSLATAFGLATWPAAVEVLQTVGDLEVSFFMVALFVSLLIAHLQLRNEELNSAQAELQTLSGLLPICAWCKKVRGDDGYWQQVEEYFASRSQIEFTHGMCNDCLNEQKAHHPECGRQG